MSFESARVWLSLQQRQTQRFETVFEIRIDAKWVQCTPATWRAEADPMRRRVRRSPVTPRTHQT